jgi:hypothetical protein
MFSVPLKCFLKQARWNTSIQANSFMSPNFFVLLLLEVKHYPFLVYFIVWKHTHLSNDVPFDLLCVKQSVTRHCMKQTHLGHTLSLGAILFVIRMTHFVILKLLPKFQGPVYTFWWGLSATDTPVLLYVNFVYTNRERQIWLRTPVKWAELAQSRNFAW